MDEIAVTAADMARILNCSTDKVYRLARSGDIPAFRLGRSWRFFPQQVIAHLQEPADPWERPPRARDTRRKAA